MSRTVMCDRCGDSRTYSESTLQQFQMVRVGGSEYDVCPPCRAAVRAFMVGPGTRGAVEELRAVMQILTDAKVPVVGGGRVSGGVAALVLDRDRLAEKVDGLEAAVTAHQGGDESE